ncbi:MAG: hypothetical protein JW818_19535 [Pirellulales bacterium]|nr:hypothetical protein [Pirellulales bacterium]
MGAVIGAVAGGAMRPEGQLRSGSIGLPAGIRSTDKGDGDRTGGATYFGGVSVSGTSPSRFVSSDGALGKHGSTTVPQSAGQRGCHWV